MWSNCRSEYAVLNPGHWLKNFDEIKRRLGIKSMNLDVGWKEFK